MSDTRHEYVARFWLPDQYGDFSPVELAEDLRNLADQVENIDLPPTGDIWDNKGRLIARTEVVEEHEHEWQEGYGVPVYCHHCGMTKPEDA